MELPGKIQDCPATVESFRVIEGFHINRLCLADDIDYRDGGYLPVPVTYHSSIVFLDNQVCHSRYSSKISL